MTVILQTTLRGKLGSRWARRLRLQGKIPANVQGDGENMNLAIDEEEFMAARRHHEHVFELELDKKKQAAMVRELQWDPFGESILHVEFHRVDLLKQTEAEVELEFAGHPKGGVLNHLMTHVKVSAIPAKIPDKIEINVDHLEIGHPLLASDLPLPEGVTLAIPEETPVATVSTVRAEAIAEGEGEGEAVEGAEAAEGAEAPAAEGEAPAKES